MENLPDADELRTSAELMAQFFAQKGLDNLKAIELFDLIRSETDEYLRQGIDLKKAEFTAVDLYAKTRGKPEKDVESDTARRTIRKDVNRFRELIDEYENELAEHLGNKACRKVVYIDEDDVRGGHKKYFRLGLRSVSAETGETASSGDGSESPGTTPKVIQYSASRFPKPMFWAAPFMTITLDGWRKVALVTLVAMATFGIAASLLWFGVGLFVGQSVFQSSLWIMLASVSSVLAYLLSPFYRAVNESVTNAPEILVGVADETTQLEFRPTASGIKQLRVVVYSAECPVCGGEVEVVRGGREFHGRMIGRCINAKREHLFSFDHITKRGVPLRQNGYFLRG